jgi:hypothetical protein
MLIAVEGGTMKTTSVLATLLLVSMLTGCSMEERRYDVSDQAGYKELIGLSFEVGGRVDAYGIKRDYPDADASYATMIPRPGIAGPEVAWEVPVKPGSIVTILKVFRTNRFLDPDMTLEVRLDGMTLPADVPVMIGLFRGNEGKGPAGLNPDIYRRTSYSVPTPPPGAQSSGTPAPPAHHPGSDR